MMSFRHSFQLLEPAEFSIGVKRLAEMLQVSLPVSLRELLAHRVLKALEVAEAFEKSLAIGVWPHIEKSALLTDLRITVKNPLNVQQKAAPLCGPAAIIFELVTRQPVRYVQICQELYETG